MKFAIGAVVLLLVGAVLADAPLNHGDGYRPNGPCQPWPSIPGICNDSGVLVWYDSNGIKTSLSLPGPKGDKGDKGDRGDVGKDGTYPSSFTLTCQPTSGSIPKGFTAKCTITVP
jgi:hypothetical protein